MYIIHVKYSKVKICPINLKFNNHKSISYDWSDVGYYGQL